MVKGVISTRAGKVCGLGCRLGERCAGVHTACRVARGARGCEPFRKRVRVILSLEGGQGCVVTWCWKGKPQSQKASIATRASGPAGLRHPAKHREADEGDAQDGPARSRRAAYALSPKHSASRARAQLLARSAAAEEHGGQSRRGLTVQEGRRAPAQREQRQHRHRVPAARWARTPAAE